MACSMAQRLGGSGTAAVNATETTAARRVGKAVFLSVDIGNAEVLLWAEKAVVEELERT